MIRRPILTIAATSFLVSLSLFIGIMSNGNVQASLFGHSVPVAQGFIIPALSQVDVEAASEEGVKMGNGAFVAMKDLTKQVTA